MNFLFIIDTSLSMSQIYDINLSFLDTAKYAVETFYKSISFIPLIKS